MYGQFLFAVKLKQSFDKGPTSRLLRWKLLVARSIKWRLFKRRARTPWLCRGNRITSRLDDAGKCVSVILQGDLHDLVVYTTLRRLRSTSAGVKRVIEVAD